MIIQNKNNNNIVNIDNVTSIDPSGINGGKYKICFYYDSFVDGELNCDIWYFENEEDRKSVISALNVTHV